MRAPLAVVLAMSCAVPTALPERAPCGHAALGSNGQGRMIIATAGESCESRLATFGFLGKVTTRCERGHFSAEGNDAEGRRITVDFAYAEPQPFCLHGRGSMRLTRGDRLVIVEQATFSLLD